MIPTQPYWSWYPPNQLKWILSRVLLPSGQSVSESSQENISYLDRRQVRLVRKIIRSLLMWNVDLKIRRLNIKGTLFLKHNNFLNVESYVYFTKLRWLHVNYKKNKLMRYIQPEKKYLPDETFSNVRQVCQVKTRDPVFWLLLVFCYTWDNTMHHQHLVVQPLYRARKIFINYIRNYLRSPIN